MGSTNISDKVKAISPKVSLTTAKEYQYFMEVLPPIWGKTYFACSEPITHDEKGLPVYTHCAKFGDDHYIWQSNLRDGTRVFAELTGAVLGERYVTPGPRVISINFGAGGTRHIGVLEECSPPLTDNDIVEMVEYIDDQPGPDMFFEFPVKNVSLHIFEGTHPVTRETVGLLTAHPLLVAEDGSRAVDMDVVLFHGYLMDEEPLVTIPVLEETTEAEIVEATEENS